MGKRHPKSKMKGKGPKSARKDVVEEQDVTPEVFQGQGEDQNCADALAESSQSAKRKRMGSMRIRGQGT
jgi:hypothetical protein